MKTSHDIIFKNIIVFLTLFPEYDYDFSSKRARAVPIMRNLIFSSKWVEAYLITVNIKNAV